MNFTQCAFVRTVTELASFIIPTMCVIVNSRSVFILILFVCDYMYILQKYHGRERSWTYQRVILRMPLLREVELKVGLSPEGVGR